MKRVFVICGVLTLLLAAAACAAPGGQIAWNDCAGDGGASNTTFACSSNSGSEALIVSWVPSQDFHHFVGAEAFVDIYFGSATVPSWWSKTCPGRTVVSVVNTPTETLNNCSNPWIGANFAGLAAYNTPIYIQHGVITPGAANTAQVDAVGAVADITPTDVVADGTEYFLFQILFSRSHTTGVDACAGCNTSATLNCQGVWVCEPAPAPQVEDYVQSPHSTVTLNQPFAVPTQEKTWGALKAMYR